MSQSLGPSAGVGGKDDDDKNRDINETKWKYYERNNDIHLILFL